jgi:aminocarboxymuconate-semialdehyde decarboxylase
MLHGWKMRPEPKVALKGSPDASFARFYYDTILHSPESLAFLVGSAGPTRVLLGSDYPYDMGTGECARQVRGLAIADAAKVQVLGAQAWSLLNPVPC